MQPSPSRKPARGAIRLWWAVSSATLIVFLLASSFEFTLGSPTHVFAFAVPAAGLCAITSAVLLAFAWRDNNGELGLFALFFLSMSILPLAHALTIPGVLYGDNPTSGFTALVALPMSAIVSWPLLAPRSRAARHLGRRWRPWAAAWTTVLATISITLLVRVDLAPSFDLRSPWAVAVVLGSGAIVVRMSLGHLRLYRLSGHTGSFVASASFIVVGASSLGWLPTEPYSAPFWISHLMDVAGVGTATVAGLIAYRQQADLREAMSPIVSLDPLKALEIGMDPTVHAFVAQLARKDQITRDHVVRVGELASRIGVRAGLNPDRLSALAIAAVLHDIGKLDIDDAILNKPGRLTSEEYSQMQTHAAVGAALLESSPALVPAAPFVLAHHERPDGAGYPNGLRAEQMPTEARIIGACDAFDAIANTRQYRKGQGAQFALSVLREHAGTQFDEEVVELLAAEIRVNPENATSVTFGEIGAGENSQLPSEPVCPDCEHLLQRS